MTQTKVFIHRANVNTISISQRGIRRIDVVAAPSTKLGAIKKMIAHRGKRQDLEPVKHKATKRSMELDRELVQDVLSFKKMLLCGRCIDLKPYNGVKTVLNDGAVCLLNSHVLASSERRRAAISSFISKQARDKLPRLTSAIGTVISICPTKISVKSLPGRWYDVATIGNVTLNCAIIALPPALQTYLVTSALLDCVAAKPSARKLALNRIRRIEQATLREYSFLLDAYS